MRNFLGAKKPQGLPRLGLRLGWTSVDVSGWIDELQFAHLAAEFATNALGQLRARHLDASLDAAQIANVTANDLGECIQCHASLFASESKR